MIPLKQDEEGSFRNRKRIEWDFPSIYSFKNLFYKQKTGGKQHEENSIHADDSSNVCRTGSRSSTCSGRRKPADRKTSIAFVPSREPEEIITATEPLKEMLTSELAKLGYDVAEVDITVGTSYEAVGEALSAGTADVGLIP